MNFMPLVDPVGPVLSAASTLAYLDPGTGSYALQLILAGVFGGMFALKQSWQQVRARLVQFRPSRRVASPSFETTD